MNPAWHDRLAETVLLGKIGEDHFPVRRGGKKALCTTSARQCVTLACQNPDIPGAACPELLAEGAGTVRVST
jgi:hypothetical protein